MQKSHFKVFTVANPPRFAADSTETQEALMAPTTTAPTAPAAKRGVLGKMNPIKIIVIGIVLVLVGCTAVRLITSLGNSLNKVINSIAGPLAMWTDLEKAKLSTGIIMAIVGALAVPLTALIVAIASRVSGSSKAVEATAAKTGATTAEISRKIGEETRPAVEKAIDQFKSNTTREPTAEEMAVIERSMTTRIMAKVSKDTMTVTDGSKIAAAKALILSTYTTQQEENNTEGSSEEAEKACNDVEPGPEPEA
jgi:hypothetical protein